MQTLWKTGETRQGAHLVAFEAADVRGPGIRDGDDLDKVGILEVACLLGREDGP
jgi:hypothetical protein